MRRLTSDFEHLAGGPFRSKGERQIAHFLDACGIEYRYEHPLAVVDRGKVRILYPDFLLSEYATVVEYSGVHGNADYERSMRYKVKAYRENRIPAIFLRTEDMKGDWQGGLLDGLGQLLVGRVTEFQKLRNFHLRPR